MNDENNSDIVYLSNNVPYIIHFGTKGMKWGVRNYQNYDGTLTPLGKARYSRRSAQKGKSGKWEEKTSKKLIDNSSNSLKEAFRTSKANSFMKKRSKCEPTGVDNVDTFTKKQGEKSNTSIEEDAKNANPDWGKKGTECNASQSIVALEMRNRGYDVQARRVDINEVSTDSSIYDSFIGSSTKKINATSYTRTNNYKKAISALTNAFQKTAKSYGENASGVLSFFWKNGNGAQSAIYWTVKDGNVLMFDAQTGKQYSGKKLSKVFKQASADTSWNLTRLDNLAISNTSADMVISCDKVSW